MLVRGLPIPLQKLAENELQEVPDEVPDRVREVRKWIEDNPEMGIEADDQWILTFLRGCKFDVEKTRRKLQFFYSLKTKNPEFFTDRDPFQPEIQEILNRGIFVLLPSTDSTQPPLLMLRWSRADPSQVPFRSLVKVTLMMLDILLRENDHFVVGGQQAIQDFEGFSVRYLLQMGPDVVRKLVLFLQDAYPTRIKGLHMINPPFYFRVLYNLVHPFLSSKMQKRVLVHSEPGISGVVRTIPPSMLPTEYGGEAGSVEDLAKEWKAKIESYRDWFVKESQ